jgi:hypothetical protein
MIMSHDESRNKDIVSSRLGGTSEDLINPQSRIWSDSENVGIIGSSNYTGNMSPVTRTIDRIGLGDRSVSSSVVVANEIVTKYNFTPRAKASSKSWECVVNAETGISQSKSFELTRCLPSIDFGDDHSTSVKTFFVEFVYTTKPPLANCRTGATNLEILTS